VDTDRDSPTVMGMQERPEDEQPGEEVPTGDTGSPDGRTLWFDKAEGLDPGAPDPGCLHEWQHLSFSDDEDEDLLCHRCGRLWIVEEDPREAMLTVWQSSRLGFHRISRRIDRLAGLLETMTGTVHCGWCDVWKEDGEGLVKLGSRHACPEHVGQLLSSLPEAEEEHEDAERWLERLRANNPDDLYALWLHEKAVVECPELPESDTYAELVGEQTVRTEGAWATLLGLGDLATVNQVVRNVSRFLELPVPVSRPGRTLILGAIARGAWAAEIRSLLDETILTEILQEIVPTENRERATVVLDLYRGEIPEDGTLSGDMADDLVEALVVRMAAELGNLFR
jgi:hypothetical protein